MKTINVTLPRRQYKYLRRRRDRLYMRKIERINISPAVCWCELVCWQSIDRRSGLIRLVDEQTSFRCKADAARDGTCYCGKFATQQAVDRCHAEFNSDYAPFIVEATQ